MKIYTQDLEIAARKHGVLSQVCRNISQECELPLLINNFGRADSEGRETRGAS